MAEPIKLEPVDRIRVTILDNATDLLIPDQGPVTRFSAPKAFARSAPRVRARFAADGVPDPLIAEHGFSALLRVERNGRERALLFDTGKLTGQREIAAIIGGFHLSGPMFEPIIAPTVRAFNELD